MGGIALVEELGYRLSTLRRPPTTAARSSALRRALAACAVMATLLTVALWPSQSFAAIIPACETDFFSQVLPPPTAAPADQSCDPPADGVDDIDNSRAAPICDLSGASSVAPPRVRGVSDLHFESGGPCDTGESLRAAVSPDRGDPPVKTAEATVDRAVLPSLEILSPSAEGTLLDPLAPAGGPRAGVRAPIYHPPR